MAHGKLNQLQFIFLPKQHWAPAFSKGHHGFVLVVYSAATPYKEFLGFPSIKPSSPNSVYMHIYIYYLKPRHSSFLPSCLTHSFVRLFVHPSIHPPFIRSFIHSFIHPFIHSFIYSLIHSFIQLFIIQIVTGFSACVCASHKISVLNFWIPRALHASSNSTCAEGTWTDPLDQFMLRMAKAINFCIKSGPPQTDMLIGKMLINQ